MNSKAVAIIHPAVIPTAQSITKPRSSKKMQQKQLKSRYLNEPIYDTTYTEVDDDYIESSRKFHKAPPRDARDLGLPKRSKSKKPAAIAAISDKKRKTKSELLDFNPTRPSKKVRKNNDWLIDAAFDQIVGAGKTVVTIFPDSGERYLSVEPYFNV